MKVSDELWKSDPELAKELDAINREVDDFLANGAGAKEKPPPPKVKRQAASPEIQGLSPKFEYLLYSGIEHAAALYGSEKSSWAVVLIDGQVEPIFITGRFSEKKYRIDRALELATQTICEYKEDPRPPYQKHELHSAYIQAVKDHAYLSKIVYQSQPEKVHTLVTSKGMLTPSGEKFCREHHEEVSIATVIAHAMDGTIDMTDEVRDLIYQNKLVRRPLEEAMIAPESEQQGDDESGTEEPATLFQARIEKLTNVFHDISKNGLNLAERKRQKIQQKFEDELYDNYFFLDGLLVKQKKKRFVNILFTVRPSNEFIELESNQEERPEASSDFDAFRNWAERMDRSEEPDEEGYLALHSIRKLLSPRANQTIKLMQAELEPHGGFIDAVVLAKKSKNKETGHRLGLRIGVLKSHWDLSVTLETVGKAVADKREEKVFVRPSKATTRPPF